jgi:hypothetical protein
MQDEPFQPPSDSELREQALEGLKSNDPRSYRDLVQEKDLEQDLDRRVQRCKRLVGNLERSGVPAWMAWDQARREVLALLPQS